MKRITNKKTLININSKKTLLKKLANAKTEFDKTIIDLAPFIPKTNSKEITTEGTWQKSSSHQNFSY